MFLLRFNLYQLAAFFALWTFPPFLTPFSETLRECLKPWACYRWLTAAPDHRFTVPASVLVSNLEHFACFVLAILMTTECLASALGDLLRSGVLCLPWPAVVKYVLDGSWLASLRSRPILSRSSYRHVSPAACFAARGVPQELALSS